MCGGAVGSRRYFVDDRDEYCREIRRLRDAFFGATGMAISDSVDYPVYSDGVGELEYLDSG